MAVKVPLALALLLALRCQEHVPQLPAYLTGAAAVLFLLAMSVNESTFPLSCLKEETRALPAFTLSTCHWSSNLPASPVGCREVTPESPAVK